MVFKYEDYSKERNRSLITELEQARQFDKYILTLAAGTFGLSFVFIEKFAPKPIEVGCLIVTAWCFFGLSILLTLTSFLISQQAHAKQRQLLSTMYKRQAELGEEERKNVWAGWTTRLNWASMFMFVFGVGFLTIFSAFNLLS